jgi:3-methyladenine DNA glycosylase AlkD
MMRGMSTTKTVLARLAKLGDAARKKHNEKAGAPANQFGVKLGDVRKLAKELGQDHELAMQLWATGNVEAQLLATQMLDPTTPSRTEVETMTKSTTCAQVADWWNSYVLPRHPEKEALRAKWSKAKDRWCARSFWALTASRVAKDADGLDLSSLLDRIEKELPKAAPEVQWTMNWTLGTIGIHHATLRVRAVAIGEAIGLYRDWPVSKGCIPPYVPVWVAAMAKRAR